MPCTLDLYTDYLLSSTGQTSATGLSRLTDGEVSHDQVTRWLASTHVNNRQVWQQAKPLIRQAEAVYKPEEFAVLIVDDTLIEKPHSEPNALLCTHYDHSQGRYVQGLNLLTLLYQGPGLALPIGAELVEKTQGTELEDGSVQWRSELTKNELLQRLLRVAQQQVAYRYLLADSWYAAAENMKLVRHLGHDFIMALPKSRTVALNDEDRKHGRFVALDTLDFPAKQPRLVYLRSLQQRVLVVRQVFVNQDGSQGTLYLVSSDTSLSYEQITTIYQRRWKVEEYHKSLKQHTGIGHSPTRTPTSQGNHFFAAILAYLKLEALKVKHSLGHFRLKAHLYAAGVKAMYQHLALLAA